MANIRFIHEQVPNEEMTFLYDSLKLIRSHYYIYEIK